MLRGKTIKKKKGLSLNEHKMVGFALKLCHYLCLHSEVLINKRYPKQHIYSRKIKAIRLILGFLKCELDNEVLALDKNAVDIYYETSKDIENKDVATAKLREALNWFDDVNLM